MINGIVSTPGIGRRAEDGGLNFGENIGVNPLHTLLNLNPPASNPGAHNDPAPKIPPSRPNRPGPAIGITTPHNLPPEAPKANSGSEPAAPAAPSDLGALSAPKVSQSGRQKSEKQTPKRKRPKRKPTAPPRPASGMTLSYNIPPEAPNANSGPGPIHQTWNLIGPPTGQVAGISYQCMVHRCLLNEAGVTHYHPT